MASHTGNVPVEPVGILSPPVAAARAAVRCGKTPNASYKLVAAGSGARIWTGTRDWMILLRS